MSYRHFSDEEAKGISSLVMNPLDQARELCDFAFVITCGFRDPQHNADIGGVPHSSHTHVDDAGNPDALAVDLEVPRDPELAKKMAAALGMAGFRQIEVAPKHFHVGMDMDRAPVLFLGVDH